MASETTCPVCNFKGVPSGKTTCPQCDADLTCFNVLNSLPDELAVAKSGSKGRMVFIVALGLFCCLTSAMFLFQHYQFKGFESRILEQQGLFSRSSIKRDIMDHEGLEQTQEKSSAEPVDRSETLTTDKQAKQDAPVDEKTSHGPSFLKKTEGSIASEEKIPKNATHVKTAWKPTEFLIYEANQKDTLWGIAGKYYGHGRYYPVLIAQNPHIEIYRIDRGIVLKILKDKRSAQKIFKEITETKGARLFFRYTVADGDTLKSIARKFYKTEDRIKRIIDLNQDIRLGPGDNLKIVLE